MKPMLAFKLDAPRQARLPVMVSPKLDGIRCLIVGGVPVSRNMKNIPNKAIFETLSKLRSISGLDGELIVGDATAEDCFRQSTSGVMSHDGEPDWIFWAFDNYLEDGLFAYRHKSASKLIRKLKHPRIRTVPHYTCRSAEEIDKYEALFLEQGYEGIMGRDANGIYKQGRSGKTDMALWKLKRFADAEAIIQGFDEQMHNANVATKDALGRTERSSHKANLVPKGTLGALKVRGMSDQFGGVEFDIGTGFSDVERQDIWNNREDWIDQVVKFRFMPIGIKDKPRFPVYLGPRADLTQAGETT